MSWSSRRSPCGISPRPRSSWKKRAAGSPIFPASRGRMGEARCRRTVHCTTRFWQPLAPEPASLRRESLVTPTFILIQLATFAYFVGIGALLPVLPRYVKGPLGGGNVAVGLAIGSFSVSALLLRPVA